MKKWREESVQKKKAVRIGTKGTAGIGVTKRNTMRVATSLRLTFWHRLSNGHLHNPTPKQDISGKLEIKRYCMFVFVTLFNIFVQLNGTILMCISLIKIFRFHCKIILGNTLKDNFIHHSIKVKISLNE